MDEPAIAASIGRVPKIDRVTMVPSKKVMSTSQSSTSMWVYCILATLRLMVAGEDEFRFLSGDL